MSAYKQFPSPSAAKPFEPREGHGPAIDPFTGELPVKPDVKALEAFARAERDKSLAWLASEEKPVLAHANAELATAEAGLRAAARSYASAADIWRLAANGLLAAQKLRQSAQRAACVDVLNPRVGFPEGGQEYHEAIGRDTLSRLAEILPLLIKEKK